MAKGKRGSGNNYTSKGERRNVARKTRNAMRREYMESSLQRIINPHKHIIEAKDNGYY